MSRESRKTVLVAMAANVVIGAAKLVAGLFTGSAAMLAEAAHSAGDTFNELMLLFSLRSGARVPDSNHPFGYGKERFFYAFMACVFMFVAGAAFSIGKGVYELLEGAGDEPGAATWFWASYAVLAVALLSEGTSWLRAMKQLRREAARASMPLVQYIRHSKDPTVKVVAYEDSAASIGIIVAAGGLAAYQVTGNAVYDAVASILIGVLLAAVAWSLGADTKKLLVGTAALPRDRAIIRRVLTSQPGVKGVIEVITMATGPESLLVAARVNLEPELDARGVERVAAELDRRLRIEVPTVRHVFIDPTSRYETPVSPVVEASQDETEAAAAWLATYQPGPAGGAA